jgi:hypothetical protein
MRCGLPPRRRPSNEASVAPSDLPQTDRILASIEHAEFAWDIGADTIAWGEGIKALLPDFPPEALATGAELAKRIEPDSALRRDAVMNASLPSTG